MKNKNVKGVKKDAFKPVDIWDKPPKIKKWTKEGNPIVPYRQKYTPYWNKNYLVFRKSKFIDLHLSRKDAMRLWYVIESMDMHRPMLYDTYGYKSFCKRILNKLKQEGIKY